MGWLYMQSLDGFAGPREYLDNQCTWSDDRVRSTLLKSALVGMRIYYAAVEVVESAKPTYVTCVVCLVRYNPNDKEGYIFGYKDMDENMGPYDSNCPAKILDLLTPTENPHALQWRQRCRARIARAMPREGDTIILAQPLAFNDGQTHQRMKAVRQGGKRSGLCFQADGETVYRIRNLKNIPFQIIRGVQITPTTE